MNMDWLKGKKTYFVASIAAVLAFADAMGWPVPEWVYLALTAAGLYTVRKAIAGQPGSGRTLLLLLLLPPVLLGATGCSFLAPGHDVRQAAEAVSETSWDANSNLTLKENTTHNRKVVMAEGDSVAADYYEDGTPKRIEGATQVLSQVSEPKDAMGAYMALAQENAKVAGKMLDLVSSLIPMFGRASSGGDGTGNAATLLQQLNALTPEQREALLGQLGAIIKPQTATPKPATRPAGVVRTRKRTREPRQRPSLVAEAE